MNTNRKIDSKNSNYLFVFGTLMIPEIQIQLFGYELPYKYDSISDYVIFNDLEIGDYYYPRLVKMKKGIVFGKVFKLTDEQISIADTYETDAYHRKIMKTNKGFSVNVYFT